MPIGLWKASFNRSRNERPAHSHKRHHRKYAAAISLESSGSVETHATHKGCRLPILNLFARAPVMKGSTALPVTPILEIQAIAPCKRLRGSTSPVWRIMIGYIGPMNSPIEATAHAFSPRDGTNHTVNWRLHTDVWCQFRSLTCRATEPHLMHMPR